MPVQPERSARRAGVAGLYGGGKFSSVLGRIREVPREESRNPPSPPSEPAKIGRPPGKRSNRTIMMHKHTHESVARILLETDDTRDLSELVDD